MATCPNCKNDALSVGQPCPTCDGWFGVDDDVATDRLRDSLVGQQLDGRYALIRKLGEGGFGSVYLAIEPDAAGRWVAIKIPRRDAIADASTKYFQRELEAAAGLNNPHTVTLLHTGTDEELGVPYLVFTYVRGRTLGQAMRTEGGWTWPLIRKITLQILSSLAEAHDLGLIHRDIKPDNVMLTYVDEDAHYVQVLDFGLARLSTGGSSSVLGSPGYAAPEQWTDPDQVAGTADVYAVAAIVWELVSGVRPHDANSLPSLVHLQSRGAPAEFRPRGGVVSPPALEGLLRRCLAAAPSQRPKDARELRAAILALSGANAVDHEGGAGPAPGLRDGATLDAPLGSSNPAFLGISTKSLELAETVGPGDPSGQVAAVRASVERERAIEDAPGDAQSEVESKVLAADVELSGGPVSTANSGFAWVRVASVAAALIGLVVVVVIATSGSDRHDANVDSMHVESMTVESMSSTTNETSDSAADETVADETAPSEEVVVQARRAAEAMGEAFATIAVDGPNAVAVQAAADLVRGETLEGAEALQAYLSARANYEQAIAVARAQRLAVRATQALNEAQGVAADDELQEPATLIALGEAMIEAGDYEAATSHLQSALDLVASLAPAAVAAPVVVAANPDGERSEREPRDERDDDDDDDDEEEEDTSDDEEPENAEPDAERAEEPESNTESNTEAAPSRADCLRECDDEYGDDTTRWRSCRRRCG